ncbi:Crp/Fnr family transcriptional regulator [Acuticoccus yangtzensis]|uniref:Crp/Fnr family transcriptional regulator n=1 Tax=Acuticoccus yangtzensis TaxID=1443441 RepID=UPI0009498C54|nr:Crp/Fnr family transcriptional regulator [Acuticoccus yangtzensis]ORE95831.1 transcriptional regulator, Crp/Fnr family protein [Stappia sp. 22II-S9-Z10]
MSTTVRSSPVRAFLAANTFIGAMEDSAIDRVVMHGRAIRYARGERIFQRDDAGDALHVVISGTVKVHNTSAAGREVVLNFLRSGDLVGEIAVLDGGPRTASATMLEPGEIFRIGRRDLLPVLRESPDALTEIISILCEKLRATSDIVETNMRKLDARFAGGLMRMCEAYGRNSPAGIVIDLSANQTDLGAYLGLSRENASRQIAKLARSGILRAEGTTLVVLDETALAQLADE